MIKKVAVILFVFSIISACNWDQADPGQENYTNPTEQNFKTNKNGLNSSPIVLKNSGEAASAKDLVQLTEQVEGVEYARSIVSGIYSVIGAKIQSGYDKEKTIENIYKKVNTHSRGANAVVTTDPTHLNKLKKWGDEINEGGLKANIYNNLGVMISQIKPNDNYPSNDALPSEEELQQERIKETP
ncbi:YhcN/YlaJ family sporulation lipoprotein [Alkalihalobacillus sp. AL-G]|uniref:YhcN/YlaJ family sporulation lipoprotein n=1 Tax=Alkalihalobacillus sp. AL-G TaxID=2926399 RepID=UPI00272B61AB|nr:YhcN/YlaJ family sporulation lipoprotein [Alkalihalobacillus sp. AL-G]WLD95239.1 YhcN/YlaJ family sporulation lipoprotein [Alkalihalobacillus sp. AL-G]